MLRCVLCDTPFEDAELGQCGECGADPHTGAAIVESDEGFVPEHVLFSGLYSVDEELGRMGIDPDDMDLVDTEERRIERLTTPAA
jgi:hypothetical protein